MFTTGKTDGGFRSRNGTYRFNRRFSKEGREEPKKRADRRRRCVGIPIEPQITFLAAAAMEWKQASPPHIEKPTSSVMLRTLELLFFHVRLTRALSFATKRRKTREERAALS
jgi:hypothetical protein